MTTKVKIECLDEGPIILKVMGKNINGDEREADRCVLTKGESTDMYVFEGQRIFVEETDQGREVLPHRSGGGEYVGMHSGNSGPDLPDIWECEMCDGVGWHEMGQSLNEKCEVCDGCGAVDKNGVLTCASDIGLYLKKGA